LAFSNWTAPLFDLLCGWAGWTPEASDADKNAWLDRGGVIISETPRARIGR